MNCVDSWPHLELKTPSGLVVAAVHGPPSPLPLVVLAPSRLKFLELNMIQGNPYFGATTLSTMTHCLMTLSLKCWNAIISVLLYWLAHFYYYAQCHGFIVMLSVTFFIVMLRVVILPEQRKAVLLYPDCHVFAVLSLVMLFTECRYAEYH